MTFVAPNLACGETRGGRIPGHGAVTDEQRSHRPNSAQPGGRQVFFAQTSLLAPHRSTAGYARRSRLVWARNPLPRTSSYLCLRPLRVLVVTGWLLCVAGCSRNDTAPSGLEKSNSPGSEQEPARAVTSAFAASLPHIGGPAGYAGSK